MLVLVDLLVLLKALAIFLAQEAHRQIEQHMCQGEFRKIKLRAFIRENLIILRVAPMQERFPEIPRNGAGRRRQAFGTMGMSGCRQTSFYHNTAIFIGSQMPGELHGVKRDLLAAHILRGNGLLHSERVSRSRITQGMKYIQLQMLTTSN